MQTKNKIHMINYARFENVINVFRIENWQNTMHPRQNQKNYYSSLSELSPQDKTVLAGLISNPKALMLRNKIQELEKSWDKPFRSGPDNLIISYPTNEVRSIKEEISTLIEI